MRVRLRLRVRGNFNIVVNGVVRDFSGKDQSAMQTQTHSVKEPSEKSDKICNAIRPLCVYYKTDKNIYTVVDK